MTDGHDNREHAAEMLRTAHESRVAARSALTHGQRDITMVILAGLPPVIVGKWSDNRAVVIGVGAAGLFLLVGFLFRTRRLHNLGGSIGAPTWVAAFTVIITSTAARATLERTDAQIVLALTYAAVFLALAAHYRRAILLAMGLIIGAIGVGLGAGIDRRIVVGVVAVVTVVVMQVFRKEFFESDAL